MDMDGYKQDVLEDAKAALEDDYSEEWLEDMDFDEWFDNLYQDDRVVGIVNYAPRHVYHSQAAQYADGDLIWDSEFWDELEMMGFDAKWIVDLFKSGPSAVDCVARDISLGYCRDELEILWNATVINDDEE